MSRKRCLLTMVSSGIRIGAWRTLSWGDKEAIERQGQVMAAKLTVYRGDSEEHLTFVSGEAYRSIKSHTRTTGKFKGRGSTPSLQFFEICSIPIS